GAMLAAEESAFLFEPMADDVDAAVLAGRRQRVDRALEAVEGVGRAVHAHLEGLVVVVAAGFASGHGDLVSGWGDCHHNRRPAAPVPAKRLCCRGIFPGMTLPQPGRD